MKKFFTRIPQFFTSSSTDAHAPDRKEHVQSAVKKVVSDYKSTLKKLENE
jgi:hypothetical protein